MSLVKESDWLLIFGAACWYFWNWRNKRLFQTDFSFPIVGLLLAYVKDIFSTCMIENYSLLRGRNEISLWVRQSLFLVRLNSILTRSLKATWVQLSPVSKQNFGLLLDIKMTIYFGSCKPIVEVDLQVVISPLQKSTSSLNFGNTFLLQIGRLLVYLILRRKLVCWLISKLSTSILWCKRHSTIR